MHHFLSFQEKLEIYFLHTVLIATSGKPTCFAIKAAR
jgi:hypothetical protein